MFLSQWEFEVIHRKGRSHMDADCVSRNVYDDAISESGESVENPLYSEEREAKILQIEKDQRADVS